MIPCQPISKQRSCSGLLDRRLRAGNDSGDVRILVACGADLSRPPRGATLLLLLGLFLELGLALPLVEARRSIAHAGVPSAVDMNHATTAARCPAESTGTRSSRSSTLEEHDDRVEPAELDDASVPQHVVPARLERPVEGAALQDEERDAGRGCG